MTMKVLVPVAEGCEEMEAVILVDVFRRAGWEVTAMGLKPGEITASRGVRLIPDTVVDDLDARSFDVLAIPGGNGGVETLCGDERILDIVRQFHAAKKWICAVCAGPLVLDRAGILDGVPVTCHPSAGSKLKGTKRSDERIIQHENIITSQGPGTTMAFALHVVSTLENPEKAGEIAAAMVF